MMATDYPQPHHSDDWIVELTQFWEAMTLQFEFADDRHRAAQSRTMAVAWRAEADRRGRL
ncbi:hypothetical protein [Nocardia transvalensis]|uniref:hypothetical protein n=1 Tax=Nocardia transvalensis TaxID=37333 RepID=UPI00189602F6|nr:hypothetical protein [Nocardia transvalensis]MBF6331056.1 hypothetical protein [Nocardia transvalensis]